MLKTDKIKPVKNNTATDSEQVEKMAFGLTPQQIQAANLLATGLSVTATAEQLGVNRSTLYDWGKLPPFYCYVNQLKSDAKKNAENSLFSLISDAVGVLRDCLNSPDEKTRFNASKYIIETVRAQEIGNTDPVKELKRVHTHPAQNFGNWDETLDTKSWERDLKRFGLDSW